MTGVKINNALEAEVSPINIITQKNHISIHNPAFIDNLLKHVNKIKILPDAHLERLSGMMPGMQQQRQDLQ